MTNETVIQYPIKIKPISPVHIGSGNEYYPYEYDPSLETNKIYIFNLDLFIQKYQNDAVTFFVGKEAQPLWKLVNEHFRQQNELIRNRSNIDNNTSSALRNWAEKGNAATIWEFNKNIQSEPYFPGSSIKGAIRTAIAYTLLKKSVQTLNKIKSDIVEKKSDDKGRARSYPGKRNAIENIIFRENSDVKKDLMRLWSFSDSKPLLKDGTLSVVQGKRLSKSKFLGFRNYYEVITEKTPAAEMVVSFSSSLSQSGFWDSEIFKNFPKKIDEIFECINIFIDDVIEWEINYFKSHQIRNQLSDLIKFYENLQVKRKSGDILLPLGKGTGWIRKTVGLLFKQDKSDIFSDIFYAYKLGKKGQKPDTFPTSREIVDETKKEVFGWIKIEGALKRNH